MACWKIGLYAMLAYGVSISAASAKLDEQDIHTIKNAATSICNTVSAAKGQKNDIQVQGDINAQLGGLIGKIAGASAKGSLTKEEFEGLSRDATATAMEGDRGCRERVFNKMFDKLDFTPNESDRQAGIDLYAECEMLVQHAPDYSKIIHYIVFQNSSAQQATGMVFFQAFVPTEAARRAARAGAPGSPASRAPPSQQCSVTGISGLPVFDVKLSLQTEFREALPVPGQLNTTRQKGALIAAHPWPITIDKITRDDPFVFYFVNRSDYFIEASLPQTVALRQGDTEKTVPLHQPRNTKVMLSPFIEQKP